MPSPRSPLRRAVLAAALAGAASGVPAQPAAFPFQDPALPIDQRVADLVGRMTLEEKASQLTNRTRAIPRLGVPEYNLWSEALHGVAGQGGVTVFPQAIGLAATFDAPPSTRWRRRPRARRASSTTRPRGPAAPAA
jgi:beta-glucosidase